MVGFFEIRTRLKNLFNFKSSGPRKIIENTPQIFVSRGKKEKLKSYFLFLFFASVHFAILFSCAFVLWETPAGRRPLARAAGKTINDSIFHSARGGKSRIYCCPPWASPGAVINPREIKKHPFPSFLQVRVCGESNSNRGGGGGKKGVWGEKTPWIRLPGNGGPKRQEL